MMLGLQGKSSSSKVYRCVACSATFTGLASLLVHQATHAGTLSKIPAPPPTQPDISPHETLFGSKDSSGEHPSPPALLSESPSPSFFICDCGEEFQDFSLMLEHKHSHVSHLQLPPPLDDNNSALSGETRCDDVFSSQHVKFSQTAPEPSLGLTCPSTSRSPAVQKNHQADESHEDGIAMVTTPLDQYITPQDGCEKELESTSSTTEQKPETEEDMYFEDETNSVLSRVKGDNLPKNNTLMKLLASAYMKRFPLAQAQSLNDDDPLTPKQEVLQVDISPGKKTEESQMNDLSVAQLRRLIPKPGIKTKAPSISRILDSSRKKVVSLTKTLSPVVVLETRQKLMDPCNNSTYGRYQCGRCRRVFNNVDRLTEHHFLHKKERIKCCRRCKQLIIGRLPFTDNHVCPQMGKKITPLSSSVKSMLPFAQKIVPFHSLNNTRKVFFCPLCKHSYARRYSLKMHKCQGPQAAPPEPASPSIERMLALRSNSRAKAEAEAEDEPNLVKSVAVGTEVTGRIKVEVTPPNSEQSPSSQVTWGHSVNNFTPFIAKSSMMNASMSGMLQQQEDGENDREGQWTIPLDDEMELLSSAGNDGDVKKSIEFGRTNLRYFVRDGVKRYPCNRCQKTYSRASTLCRHLRLCGFRPRGPAGLAQSGSHGAIPLNSNNVRPMFPCSVCGKTFNRKDNMMVHRKKCQLHHSVNREIAQKNISGNATDSQPQDDDGANWGIMSLPSVLPRRVTCECGVGFTSPRLLLEHLQKHAQESYTCPTCGETVSSWADYEVHLQIHMHPHHQLLKGLQPQRSQPLLLRFQQQPSQQQQPQAQPQPQPQPPPSPSQPVQPPPQKQLSLGQFTNPGKRQQRIVCTRCGNTFATRCSLRRHLSWNRCKGGRVTNPPTNPPKTYRCSHCNSDFPNTISLAFHQRSGACKPAIKPVRCPVCLRWFGTVESLQKHLLTHKQSESYRCDVCQGTYPNLKSLKNHRRRVHRIMAGDAKPQELLTT